MNTIASKIYTVEAPESQQQTDAELKAKDPVAEKAKALILAHERASDVIKLRASGIICYDEAEKFLGRPLTDTERTVVWNNKDYENMER